MNDIVIGLVLVMIGLSAVMVLVSGVKSVTNGKSDFKKVGLLSVPFVLFGITFAVMGDAQSAGMATTLVMLGLMAVTIMFTGLKGTFKF